MNGVEVYALADGRGRSVVERFLQRFGPVDAPLPPPYPYPQFDASPSHAFGSLDALLAFLAATPEASYALYWSAAGSPVWPRPLMAFFTADGGLVLGTVVDPSAVAATLTAFAEAIGARHGRTDTMLPPESTSAMFVHGCRSCAGPRLIDGVLVDG